MPAGNVGPWLVLDSSRVAGELAVDPESAEITASAGVVAAEANEVAASTGLALPALPSSAPWATLGGIVASNASGARSLRFGPARRWLRAARWVDAEGNPRAHRRHDTPDPPRWSALHDRMRARFGERLPWPEVAKNSSGYALDAWLPSGDPLDLLCGSEGTLGILTDVTLGLHPPDEERWVAVAGLPALADLGTGAALAAGLGANACEFFGRTLVQLGGLGVDPRLSTLVADAGMLLIEFGGSEAHVQASATALRQWAQGVGGIVEAETEEARSRLWALRHEASPRIMQQVGAGRRSIQFIEDCVVPLPRLPEFVRRLQDILDEHDVPVVIFGHAGQGNLHVNPLVDTGEPGWRDTVSRILEEVVELVAELGGTLAGEHGDGRLRTPFLDRIFAPEVVEAFRAVKYTLDPTGILNPGVIVPSGETAPLAGLGEAPDFARGSQGPEVERR